MDRQRSSLDPNSSSPQLLIISRTEPVEDDFVSISQSVPSLEPRDSIQFRKTFPQLSRSDERDAVVLRAQVDNLKTSLEDTSLHLLRAQRENKVPILLFEL